MNKLRFLMQHKVLRMIALGLALLASVLLLVQDNYGSHYAVAVGEIEVQDGIVTFRAVASSPKVEGEFEVSANWFLQRRLNSMGIGNEFLGVVRARGENYVFHRLYALEHPQLSEDQVRRGSGVLDLALGNQPELVQLIGLDRYGYLLNPPSWSKGIVDEATLVYYHQGRPEYILDILEGNEGAFGADVFALDAQGRPSVIWATGDEIRVFPALLRQSALWLYVLAVFAGLGSVASYKSDWLLKKGKSIWDQVSSRWRKEESSE